MTDRSVVILEDASQKYQFSVNLGRCSDTWANLTVGYQCDNARPHAAVLGWNGKQLSNRGEKRRLIHERPDVFAEVSDLVAPHSVQSLVDLARGTDCWSYDVATKLFPRPALEYGVTNTFGIYRLEAATTMRAKPWLNFRVIGPGKRGPRKFYGSWNGTVSKGDDWYQLSRMHPQAWRHVKSNIFTSNTPTQLCAFAQWAELEERKAA